MIHSNLPPLEQAITIEVDAPPPPPPPVMIAKPVTLVKKPTGKEPLHKIVNDIDKLIAPFHLNSPDTFKAWAGNYLPGMRFCQADLEKFSRSFEAWKQTYLNVLEIAETGPVEMLAEKKNHSVALFERFMTEFTSSANLQEAKQKFTEQSQKSAAEVTDEMGKFGGLSSEYRTLLKIAKRQRGSHWFNQLMRAYNPDIKPGETVQIDAFEKWLKAEGNDPIVLSARERIGTNLKEFTKTMFKEEKALTFPVDKPVLSKALQERLDKLDDKAWLQEAKNLFSKTDGWKTIDPKLKEEAVLIYAMRSQVSREMTNMAEDIVNYYFVNELSVKYQQ